MQIVAVPGEADAEASLNRSQQSKSSAARSRKNSKGAKFAAVPVTPKKLSMGENKTQSRSLVEDDVIHYARLGRVRRTKMIRGLRFERADRLAVEPVEMIDGRAQCWVILSGVFAGEVGEQLLFERRDLVAVIKESGQKIPFTVKLPMDRLSDDLVFDSVDSAGKIQAVQFIVTLVTSKSAERLRRRWTTSVSAGPTLVVHAETSAPSFEAWLLTVKGTFDFRFAEKWTVGAFAYGSALPLLANIDGITPRFLGVSMRVSYATSWLSAPWFLNWSLGYYYTSLFGVGDTYGFMNILGPQPIPYPTLGRQFNDGSLLTLTPKYSPIVVSMRGGWFDQQQLAFGMRYVRPLRDERTWFLSADYSRFTGAVGADAIRSTSFSLAGGVGF